MPEKHNIAPDKLELVMAVVHNSKAAYYSSIIQSHQANLQFSMAAKGTTHLLLDYLGLSDNRPKSLVMSVVRSDEAGSLISQLEELFQKGEDYKGIAFSIRLTSVIGTLAYGFLSNDKRVKEEA
jgi:hypothetical protein